MLSNFAPIRKAVATSLRDSLDLFRKNKTDSLTVTLTHLKNLGISPLQTLLGLSFALFGFLIYIFIPLSMTYHMPTLFFFVFLSIMFALIVGLTYLSQIAIPFLESLILSALTTKNLLTPQDRPLAPVIRSNLKAHRARNSKSALALMITVTFLIFCGSAFSQFEYVVKSLSRAVINGDVSLFIANIIEGQTPISVREEKLREYMDSGREKLGIEGYTFTGWTLNELISGADGNFQELFIGVGMKSQ